MVPHLTTALSGPLLDLEKRILNKMPEIEHWFRTQWLDHGAPFYASVDLRNSGFKPVSYTHLTLPTIYSV